MLGDGDLKGMWKNDNAKKESKIYSKKYNLVCPHTLFLGGKHILEISLSVLPD